jgi:hypothetical protein
MVVVYLIIFVSGVLSWLFGWPALLCIWNKGSQKSIAIKGYFVFMGIAIPTSIMAIIGGFIVFTLSIIQIFVPELTVFVFKVHKWGKPEIK